MSVSPEHFRNLIFKGAVDRKIRGSFSEFSAVGLSDTLMAAIVS